MYKRFSDYYDLLTFDIDYERYANNIFKILEGMGIKEGNLLEIACGTGNLTERLAKGDFEILAFDNSLDMLNKAFPKLVDLDNVTLVMQDMFSFDYSSFEYDGVVCLLDVINYITDEKDLKDFFTKVYGGLRDGGVFIFDINSEDKLKRVLANNSFIYEKDNIFYTWENTMEGDLVNFYLNFFIEGEDGLYTRVEESQLERYYSLDQIKKTLAEVGFKDISLMDEDTGKDPGPKSQRILIKAVKRT